MDSIGFGIVGLGIGTTRIDMIMSAEGARLAAVADKIPHRRHDAVAKYGAPAYEDYRKLLEDDSVDVVGFFTPAGTHLPLVSDALSAGKHVIVTKAMEINIERCDRMIELARQHGRLLAVDFESRYLPHNRAIKQAIDEGLFGRILMGEAKMKCSRGQDYYGWNGGWRGTWRWDGGGSLANQAVHYVDRLRWFMGPPKSVFAHSGVHAHQIEAEDQTSAVLTWENGAYGTLASTTNAVPDFEVSSIEIHGTRGGVSTLATSLGYTPDPTGKERIGRWIMTDDRKRAMRLEPIDVEPGPRNIIEDMVSALKSGTRLMVPGEEGRWSVEILNGVYQSAVTGEPVLFPLTDPFVPEGGYEE